jgi:reverse gyrase
MQGAGKAQKPADLEAAREMTKAVQIFDLQFEVLSGFKPLDWQRRLFGRLVRGDLPSALDLPTGLGKTSAMAIWLIARAHGANLPRRLASNRTCRLW